MTRHGLPAYDARRQAPAHKETSRPIEQHAPGLERIVGLHQEIEELASGFGGPTGPAEGPVWWQEGSYLLFSDIGNNRRMQWTHGEGVSLFQEPTNEANGLTRDRQGRLVACEHLARRVTRQDPDGSLTVVAYNYRGRRRRLADVVFYHLADPGPYPDEHSGNSCAAWSHHRRVSGWMMCRWTVCLRH